MSLLSKRNESRASKKAYRVCGEREMVNACEARISTFLELKKSERSRRNQFPTNKFSLENL